MVRGVGSSALSVLQSGALALLFLACVLSTALSKDPFDEAESELTITLRAGAIECFHQPAKPGQVLEVEYQVLDSNFGNMEVGQKLDINFFMMSPTKQELIKEYARTDAVHRHEVKEHGDHAICFDNSPSMVASRTVYFEVYVDNTNSEEDEWDPKEIPYSPELIYNDTVSDIKATIKKVHENMDKVKHFQDTMRAHEARDRNIQEHNFIRVNQFSLLFIVVMLGVGAVQVIMVRSLFEERSRLRKVFKFMS
ncbi:transmembrane emp24 domain-containing protein 5 [Ixodes scapularis]|uniref:transmembrane emp24 domain-containing protein 5 n=1 Tax=Ixodes scapularis TaxID=6945 RepID=UPI001C395456|nr:transmembrane emp24 domain-containing protein 5 [Ixodes scapularis]